MGITPPGFPRHPLQTHWDDLGLEQQMNVINYNKIASHDEDDLQIKLATLGIGQG